ncbi:MAG: DUF4956 domain-containing protein [Clostridia bacterium]|nr:DUF4956 domain-containing protein [Clostridia bacterium]
MFNSIFTNGTTVGMVFLMVGLSLVFGVLYAFIVSRRQRSSKGFFITLALMPMMVSIAICLLGTFLTGATETVSRIATIAVALGLVRFRSTNGKAEEMLTLLGTVVAGLVFGLGYAAYGAISLLLFGGLYVGLSYLPIFKSKKFAREKLLKITIPETLNYSDVFDATFTHYLKEHEMVGVKTTGMGSMFRLSYRIVMKNPAEEKEMIDELRIRNGNLEISVLPYVDDAKSL